MTCIAIHEPGGPEVLVPEQQPLPSPAEGEILVKVIAAGVNRPDLLQRKGQYPPPKGATEIPGSEIAGEVVAIGRNVNRWKEGYKVMGSSLAAAMPSIVSPSKATLCHCRRRCR
jgi:NADPH:quinone reductase-like Zn-dependent oxidoreductase